MFTPNNEKILWNKKEKSITFKGCNEFNGVGEEPYGRLIIDSLMTPT